MLGSFQIFEVLSQLTLVAFFIRVDCIVQRRGPESLPGGAARTKRESHQNGEHDKQCLCHPERKKNLEEQTLHDVLTLRCLNFCFFRAFPRPGKNVANTPDSLDVLVAIGIAEFFSNLAHVHINAAIEG
jgi:hypothetical protein